MSKKFDYQLFAARGASSAGGASAAGGASSASGPSSASAAGGSGVEFATTSAAPDPLKEPKSTKQRERAKRAAKRPGASERTPAQAAPAAANAAKPAPAQAAPAATNAAKPAPAQSTEQPPAKEPPVEAAPTEGAAAEGAAAEVALTEVAAAEAAPEARELTPAEARELTPAEARARKAVRSLQDEAAALQGLYPRLNLTELLRDPVSGRVVAALQRAGVPDPVRVAYEAKHRGRIMGELAARARHESMQMLSASVAANGARPAENGMRQGGVGAGLDVRKLTKEQRADIRRRVRAGEKISF